MEEKQYREVAVERAMKVQEVILRAMAKRITWWEAAEILGIHDRTMRRWRGRMEKDGYAGLFDRRRHPSPKRVPLEQAERVLSLYQEKYAELNVRHFHEKLGSEHDIELSYTWVKKALQTAGLVKTAKRGGPYRKRRPRRPLPGMMLHIDASRHQWFSDERWHDLIVVLDDATSEVYYAQLVVEESTRTVMAALCNVVETKGWFSSLYSDRASHFFRTPKAGQPVDTREVTEVGRAMRDLGIRMIPAYSPQARGRSERNFGTWQGRLPQELRLKDIHTPEQANAFLNDHYIGEFNGKFMVATTETGTAFAPVQRQDLDRVFAIQQERTVGKDNTIQFANDVWQVPPTPFRATLAGCRVIVYEHLDGTFSVGYGPHTVARFTASGDPASPPTAPASRRKLSKDAKNTHAASRTRRRTWPMNDPGAKNFRPTPLRAEAKGQGPRPSRRRRIGASASATPQNASPYGLRWGSAPADAPIRRSKGAGKKGKRRT